MFTDNPEFVIEIDSVAKTVPNALKKGRLSTNGFRRRYSLLANEGETGHERGVPKVGSAGRSHRRPR